MRDLDGYRLGRRIAVGGMAEIFEAEAKDGACVVVKVLLPQYARDPEIVRLLEHEGRLMQRLAHERLVRVIDVHASGETPYLVLERVDGAAADEVIEHLGRRGDRVSAAMALALVLPVLDALAHVHGARDEAGAALDVVHRDVTPHNVLITRGGEVRLGDFGIARSSLRDARTRTGVIRGKLRYLAPEQATGSSVDARTDLYCVGVMLWELLTGHPYLEGSSEVECLRAAEEPVYREPSSVADVDPRFDRVLARLLARFPEERPQSAASVRTELTGLAEGIDLDEGRAAWAREVSAMVREAPREPTALPAQRSLGPWMLGALVLGAIAVAGYAALEPEADRPIRRTESRRREPIVDPRTGDRGAPAIEPEPIAAPALEDASAVVDARARRAIRARVVPEPASREEPAPDVAPLRARLRDLLAELRRRGVLESDLAPDQRAAMAAIAHALEREDAADAEQRLHAIEPSLAAIEIDERFMRAKLERVDARIRAARARGADTSEVERLSALALADLIEGRHEATNRRLNLILAILDRLP